MRMYDEETYTPLYYAVINNHEDATKLLLEHGADPVMYSEEACTVLKSIIRELSYYDSLAYHVYRSPTLQLLEDYRDNNGRQVLSMVCPNNIDMYVCSYDPRHDDDSELR